MACNWNRVPFGATGLNVMPLGLGSSFGVGGTDLERAFERGINYFYWGSRRRPAFGEGMRAIGARKRDDAVFVIQTYSRSALLIRPSLERALRAVRTDYADVLLLGWWNKLPSERILDAARELRRRGLARHILISCHHRPAFERFIADPTFDAIMTRYNAGHPGAETEVFPHLAKRRVGVVAYTATRWGTLLDPKFTPPGEPTPRPSDCYRFALTNPNVDVCIAGPRDGAQLDEAMATLDRGPMSDDELAWIKRVGSAARAAGATQGNPPIQVLDRVMDWIS